MGPNPSSVARARSVLWSFALPEGLQVPGWHQPVLVDDQGLAAAASSSSSPPPPRVLVLGQPSARRRLRGVVGKSDAGSDDARLFALDLARGKAVWSMPLNGSGRAPAGAADGASAPLVAGGLIMVETCPPEGCCVKAVNLSTGAEAWELCAPAAAGRDATHPHAQFAIWLVMLATFAAILGLVLGACAIYVRAWLADVYRPLSGYRLQLLPMPDGQDDWYPPSREWYASESALARSGQVAAAPPAPPPGSLSWSAVTGLVGPVPPLAGMRADDSPPRGFF